MSSKFFSFSSSFFFWKKGLVCQENLAISWHFLLVFSINTRRGGENASKKRGIYIERERETADEKRREGERGCFNIYMTL